MAVVVVVGDEPELRADLRRQFHLTPARDLDRLHTERELPEVQDIGQALLAGDRNPHTDLDALVRSEAWAPRRHRPDLLDELPATRGVGEDDGEAERPERAETGERDQAAPAPPYGGLLHDEDGVVDVAAAVVLLARRRHLVAPELTLAKPHLVAGRALIALWKAAFCV